MRFTFGHALLVPGGGRRPLPRPSDDPAGDGAHRRPLSTLWALTPVPSPPHPPAVDVGRRNAAGRQLVVVAAAAPAAAAAVAARVDLGLDLELAAAAVVVVGRGDG